MEFLLNEMVFYLIIRNAQIVKLMSLEHEEMFDFAYITHYMTSKALCICLHHYSRDTYQSRHNYLVWHNVLNTETHKCIFLWSLRNIHYNLIIWHDFCICKGGIQIRMQRKTVIGCICFLFCDSMQGWKKRLLMTNNCFSILRPQHPLHLQFVLFQTMTRLSRYDLQNKVHIWE